MVYDGVVVVWMNQRHSLLWEAQVVWVVPVVEIMLEERRKVYDFVIILICQHERIDFIRFFFSLICNPKVLIYESGIRV